MRDTIAHYLENEEAINEYLAEGERGFERSAVPRAGDRSLDVSRPEDWHNGIHYLTLR